MSIVARNECDWLKEAASHTLGNFTFHYWTKLRRSIRMTMSLP
jgi:hypothetical protein